MGSKKPTSGAIRVGGNAVNIDAGSMSAGRDIIVHLSGTAPAKPAIISTVTTPSPTFVPRTNITAAIHAALQTNPGETVIRQVVTRAMGGYGKTVAAILYAEQYKDHYPGGRFMLRLETADFAQELGNLAAKLGLPVSKNAADDASAVCDRLATALTPDNTPQPSLLILDNVTSKAAWEMRGMRGKAAGTAHQLTRCPECGHRSWHTISRTAPTDRPLPGA